MVAKRAAVAPDAVSDLGQAISDKSKLPKSLLPQKKKSLAQCVLLLRAVRASACRPARPPTVCARRLGVGDRSSRDSLPRASWAPNASHPPRSVTHGGTTRERSVGLAPPARSFSRNVPTPRLPVSHAPTIPTSPSTGPLPSHQATNHGTEGRPELPRLLTSLLPACSADRRGPPGWWLTYCPRKATPLVFPHRASKAVRPTRTDWTFRIRPDRCVSSRLPCANRQSQQSARPILLLLLLPHPC